MLIVILINIFVLILLLFRDTIRDALAGKLLSI